MMYPQKKRIHFKFKGFTLIELLVVIALIALITGLTIPGFTNFVKRKNFDRAVNQFVSDLQSAQLKSQSGSLITNGSGALTAGQNTSGFWGIHLSCGNNATGGNYDLRYLTETSTNSFTVTTTGSGNNLETRGLNSNSSSRPYWFDSSSGMSAPPGLVQICSTAFRSIYFDRFTGSGFSRSNQSAFSVNDIIEIPIRASDIGELRVIRVYKSGKIEVL